ncbi:8924_t:CDS:2 [Scutellospora calospora]|uniref:8924_t:CDS:1 n=1 Tax=Scutellospora calospora TaxID=85575 RepID=A0ACA9JU91_9GLOM|nr:8924_t:CDS:2 [Scutellospora calospora]
MWGSHQLDIKEHLNRPNEPYYKFSPSASMAYYTYQRYRGRNILRRMNQAEDQWTNLGESPVFRPVRSALDLSSSTWDHCNTLVPRQVNNIMSYTGPPTDLSWNSFILFPMLIYPIYFLFTIPTTIITFLLLYFPMVCKFEYALWKSNIGFNARYNFTSFITTVTGSILIPILVLLGDIMFFCVVLCASTGAVFMVMFRSFDEGLAFCSRVAMGVPETYLEMILEK